VNKIEDLKKALADELARKSIDFGRILQLASELSKHDSTSAAFSVNATIIRRLGRELVAAQETALAELVKNAFDADADTTKVIFSGTEKAGGRLLIQDDGSGMTPDQVRDGFLRIASDEKEAEPVSPKYKRRRAGQKGIGRFAVERLGKRLLLITATAGDELATELDVEWAAFEQSADLSSVRQPIKRLTKSFPQGTTLVIDGLREPWSMEAIQTAEAYVSDLQEPKYFAHVFQANKSPQAPGVSATFSVEFSVLDGVKPTPIPQSEVEVVNSALAVVEATVDDKGRWEINVSSSPLKYHQTLTLRDIPKKKAPIWSFSHLRSVKLRAAYFVSDAELLPGIRKKKLEKILRARGGIKLYRNGFRVPPYGNPGDDWLKLDRLEAARAILVPIKRTNWVGYVSINDLKHELAIETSSREGLIVNEFFNELVAFSRNVLLEVATEVGRRRGKKIYASDTSFGQAKSERALKAAKTIARYLQDLQSTREGRGSDSSKEAITDATLAEVRTELEALVKDATELTGEVSILRVFASVGMSVLMFSHEVKGLLANMISQINTLTEDRELPSKTKRHLKGFQGMLDRLQHLTNFYESTGSAAADRSISEADPLSLVNGFVESFAPQAEKRGIALRFEGDSTSRICKVAMHEAELSAVLINLYTNAVKAIQRTAGKKREIVMRHSRVGNNEVVEVLDTGAGIKASDRKKIFDPFFTTTPVKRALRPGDADMFGTGLGLTIARDAIESARGTIDVVTPAPKGFSTCLRIELPQIPHEKEK
jgi:signal transduction histidine kinase